MKITIENGYEIRRELKDLDFVYEAASKSWVLRNMTECVSSMGQPGYKRADGCYRLSGQQLAAWAKVVATVRIEEDDAAPAAATKKTKTTGHGGMCSQCGDSVPTSASPLGMICQDCRDDM